MKVTIVGAGAIGGFIGTRLAAAGHCSVSAIAQGDTLAALRQHGWRLQQHGQWIEAPAHATDDAHALGPQDLVIVALKGPALLRATPSIAALLGPQTVVLPAMNGVPWWFGLDAALGNAPLQSVDPGGEIARLIPLPHVLGCVVHASCMRSAPGVVQHVMGDGLILGEPAGGHSARAEQVGALLSAAGFSVTVSQHVRYDIWYKLWGNMTMNPISAITGATTDQILADPLVRDFCTQAMQEAAAIGERMGCAIAQTPQDRHAITAKLGAFKTSMLQDAQAQRPIELDSIVTAVQEIGLRVGVPTPSINALLGLARLFGRVHQLYPSAAA
jgi:2-dehydropantoate 2-reductase